MAVGGASLPVGWGGSGGGTTGSFGSMPFPQHALCGLGSGVCYRERVALHAGVCDRGAKDEQPLDDRTGYGMAGGGGGMRDEGCGMRDEGGDNRGKKRWKRSKSLGVCSRVSLALHGGFARTGVGWLFRGDGGWGEGGGTGHGFHHPHDSWRGMRQVRRSPA